MGHKEFATIHNTNKNVTRQRQRMRILLTVTHPDFKDNESHYTQIQALIPRDFDLAFQKVQKEENIFRETEYCRHVFSFLRFLLVCPSSPELVHSRPDVSHKADDLLCQEGTSLPPGQHGRCFQQISLQPAMAHLIIPLQVQDLLDFVTNPSAYFSSL